MAEKPHWGSAPRAAPTTGPALPERSTIARTRSLAECSIASMAR